MSQSKRTDAEEKAVHAHRDTQVDDAVEGTFPVSTTSPGGSRKAKQIDRALPVDEVCLFAT